MTIEVITKQQIANRNYWIDEIGRLSGNFGVDANKVEQELAQEIQSQGLTALLGHLRLCGAIPEKYGHDTSEEKLYSKYTDVVIHEAFTWIGLTSVVLSERANAADVECICDAYSFVADAKAFRLSRTAKNQKDFKIQAMDTWKYGKPYAMVICPVYQLPSRSSQIYAQAATRSVYIATYTHLAVLVRYAQNAGKTQAMALLHEIFKAVAAMNPSLDAVSYWQTVNRVFLDDGGILGQLWQDEKRAAAESIGIIREEALVFLAAERERIMRLSREEAIREVLEWRKLESRVRAVKSVADSGILEFV